MNLERLRKLIADAEASKEGVEVLVRELRDAIHRGDERRDPLGIFILKARQSYRSAEKATNKGTNRIDVSLNLSLQEARKLGFFGSHVVWWGIMKCGKSWEEIQAENPPGWI